MKINRDKAIDYALMTALVVVSLIVALTSL